MMYRLSNVQKLDINTNVTIMKKISKFSITNYLRSVGIELKTAMISMSLISRFSIYLAQFMIYLSQRF